MSERGEGRAGKEGRENGRSVILILTLFVFAEMVFGVSHLSHLPHLARERNCKSARQKKGVSFLGTCEVVKIDRSR